MTDQVVVEPSGGVGLRFGTRPADILSTIANLSSDEVFTPPELANRMLDGIEAAWAADHDGEIIWSRPDIRFLDPATKSGVFLREIAKRLVEHQGNPPENSDERKALVDRILTTQVYGIGVTTLTSLLARRSVYCTKDATGKHSVAPSFDREWGNIWFEPTEHTWIKREKERRVDPLNAGEEITVELEGTGRCAWCGSPESVLNRGDEAETHAYALIHTDDPQKLVDEMFGEGMQFDVIIGNPPYQLDAGDDTVGSFAVPIYPKFVKAAQAMNPRYLTMVTPSKWMVGGRWFRDFRESMFKEGHLRTLVDYPMWDEVFPGTKIDGGVSYFLWDRDYTGDVEATLSVNGNTSTTTRDLSEFDVFVREPKAIEILRKVLAFGEQPVEDAMTSDRPFGLTTNYGGFHKSPRPGDISLHYNRKGDRLVGYIPRSEVTKNHHLIDKWKVLVPVSYGEKGFPLMVLSKPFIAAPPSACTQTYFTIATDSRLAAESVLSYYATKFFRFMVSLRKIAQHASNSTYRWVPQQTWDRTWTDAELYAKYGLTTDEIGFVESRIRPMVLDADSPQEA